MHLKFKNVGLNSDGSGLGYNNFYLVNSSINKYNPPIGTTPYIPEGVPSAEGQEVLGSARQAVLSTDYSTTNKIALKIGAYLAGLIAPRPSGPVLAPMIHKSSPSAEAGVGSACPLPSTLYHTLYQKLYDASENTAVMNGVIEALHIYDEHKSVNSSSSYFVLSIHSCFRF